MCWLWGFQQFGGLDNFCNGNGNGNGKGKGKGKGKGQGNGNGKGREASLRQSGSAFGAAIVGRAEALPFRFVKICFRFARVLPFGKLRARSCL